MFLISDKFVLDNIGYITEEYSLQSCCSNNLKILELTNYLYLACSHNA